MVGKTDSKIGSAPILYLMGVVTMWSVYLYGRQSRKRYLHKSFDTLTESECVNVARNIFGEFKSVTPWAEDLDLFISSAHNTGCVRSFNHLWRWDVSRKVQAQYSLVE